MQKLLSAIMILLFIVMNVSVLPIEKEELIKKVITVEIKGAVKNPGLLECPAYSTAADILDKISLEENADLSMLSLQTVLKDKDVLTIAEKEDYSLISINTASIEKLCTLEGIGRKTAQLIIDYREEKGFFQSLEELKNIKGIGQKKFEKIKDKICL